MTKKKMILKINKAMINIDKRINAYEDIISRKDPEDPDLFGLLRSLKGERAAMWTIHKMLVDNDSELFDLFYL